MRGDMGHGRVQNIPHRCERNGGRRFHLRDVHRGGAEKMNEKPILNEEDRIAKSEERQEARAWRWRLYDLEGE